MYKLIKNIIIAFVCHFLFHVKYENLDILDKYDKCLIFTLVKKTNNVSTIIVITVATTPACLVLYISIFSF